MAIIIDLFSKKVLAINPESVESSEWFDQSDWYSQLRMRMEIRFGNKMPQHFHEEMQHAEKNGANFPYMWGCIHNVKTKQKRDQRFNNPMPVPCKVNENVEVLAGGLNHGDPLAWIDAKWRCSWNHIKARKGKSLKIITASDLIAHSDYIEILDKKTHEIEIIISPYSENELRDREPGAPSNERRMLAYKRLKFLDFNVKIKKVKKLAA